MHISLAPGRGLFCVDIASEYDGGSSSVTVVGKVYGWTYLGDSNGAVGMIMGRGVWLEE